MSAQIESLKRFVADHVSPWPRESSAGVLVVGSGKGGSGTSSVAALLALAAAEPTRRVLLVDGDDSIGALHLLLGVERRDGIAALRRGAVEPEELVVPVAPGLELLAGGGAEPAAELPGAAERRAMQRRVSSLYDRYELVVVDGGSRLEAVLGACAAGCERLLAVSGIDRVSLAAGYALVKTVDMRLPGLPVELLVNRASTDDADVAFETVRNAVGHFLGRDLEFAGAVPDDARLRSAVDAGSTLQSASDASPAAAAVAAAWARLGWKLKKRAKGSAVASSRRKV